MKDLEEQSENGIPEVDIGIPMEDEDDIALDFPDEDFEDTDDGFGLDEDEPF